MSHAGLEGYDLEEYLKKAYEIAISDDGDIEEFIAMCLEEPVDIDQLKPSFGLLAACKQGVLSVVQELLDKGDFLINTRDPNNHGLLYIAAINEHPGLVRYLLTQNAVDYINNDGSSALSESLQFGFHAVVLELGRGDLKQYGYTDLMLEILKKNYVGAEQLIENATIDELNKVTQGGYSALMIVAEFLSKSRWYPDNDDGNAAAKQEVEALRELVLDLLIGGANPFLKNRIGTNFLTGHDDYHAELFSDSDFLLNVMETCLSPEFIRRNQGRNFFHLSFFLERNMAKSIFEIYEGDGDSAREVANIARAKDFLNRLDADGNSPLSFALLSDSINIEDEDVIPLVHKYGAKFVRNGVEIKSKYHLGVLCYPGFSSEISPEEYFSNSDHLEAENYKKQLQQLDENGRNILHLAYMQGSNELVELFRKLSLELGINFNVKDVHGRLPIHYALSDYTDLPPEELADFVFNADNDGITPLILRFQLDSIIEDNIKTYLDTEQAKTIMQRLKSENKALFFMLKCILKMDKIDVDDESAGDALINKISRSKKINIKQKLALFGALHKIYASSLDDTLQNLVSRHAKQQITNHIKDNKANPNIALPPGMALGIELEIPLGPDAIFCDFLKLIEWFGLRKQNDSTLYTSSIGINKNIDPSDPDEIDLAEIEVISGIIQTPAEYLRVLDFCQIIKDGGARVNSSAGMHIHVNCRGSTKTSPALPRFVTENDEFIYLKFLAINYISIEHLLRGFMRDGNVFDSYGAAYVKPISEFKDRILAAKTVKELQQICTHMTTLDFTALSRHGTTEFRIHEGTIEPILINAWAEIVTRLAIVSKQQALSYTGGEIVAKPDIEQLVYLLIALREYKKTWHARWGAVQTSETQTANVYPGHDQRAAQLQIQESPLYNMMSIILAAPNVAAAKENLRGYIQSLSRSSEETDSVISDLLNLVKFAADNVGLFQFPALQHSGSIIDAIESLSSRHQPSPRRPRFS